MKEGGMDATCSTHTKFQLESLKVRDNFRDLGVDGRIILKRIIK
jgi:hypothetical protein